MNYTRKEITSWVESQTKYKFQQLKNGVFFCRMLCLRFPEETLKFKYNPAPISEYDALNNLTAMKKLLNKLGLQLHLNIHSVLNSKNNFDLAKWFKALVDREISVDNPGNFDNKSQKMSRDSSTVNRMTIESNFSSAKTPKNRPEEMQNFRKHLQSAQKDSKHSNSIIKRLSMAKSQNHFFKEKKKPSYPDLKIPMSRKMNSSKQRLNQTQPIKSFDCEDKEEDSIKNLLYERALEESIEAFEKIIGKIEAVVQAETPEDQQFSHFKQKLRRAIFEK